MNSFAAYTTQPEQSWRYATVHGMDVAYEYERADWDVGLPEVYLLAAIQMGGAWVTFEAFRDDFWEAIENAIPEAVRVAADEVRA
jgi:hypothetical protein